MALPRVEQAFDAMPRIDALMALAGYREALAAVEHAERDRAWCRHGLPHLLDVARIAWIYLLASDVDVPRDVVYAAALLHDIGRAAEYETGEPHDVAGARIAADLLDALPIEFAFSGEERAQILTAVSGHRGTGDPAGAEGLLVQALRAADKASRPCFACASRSTCHWPEGKMNLTVRI